MVEAVVPLVAVPSGELDETRHARADASDAGGGAGQLGVLAAAVVIAARSRMTRWQLHHGMERSRTASVQVTLFGPPDCTGTLRLSTALARRSGGHGFCDVRIAEECGRRAGLGTVVLGAGRPSIANDLDADGPVQEGAVLALIDSAATRAICAATGSQRRIFPVSLHAGLVRPLPGGQLSAHAVVRTCDGRSAWCDVEVVGPADGLLYAIGSIVALV